MGLLPTPVDLPLFSISPILAAAAAGGSRAAAAWDVKISLVGGSILCALKLRSCCQRYPFRYWKTTWFLSLHSMHQCFPNQKCRELRLRLSNCAALRTQPVKVAVHWKAHSSAQYSSHRTRYLSACPATILETPVSPQTQLTTAKATLSTGASDLKMTII